MKVEIQSTYVKATASAGWLQIYGPLPELWQTKVVHVCIYICFMYACELMKIMHENCETPYSCLFVLSCEAESRHLFDKKTYIVSDFPFSFGSVVYDIV